MDRTNTTAEYLEVLSILMTHVDRMQHKDEEKAFDRLVDGLIEITKAMRTPTPEEIDRRVLRLIAKGYACTEGIN
jgi:hypothetical protein